MQIGRAIFGASARIRIEVLPKETFEWFMGIQCSWFLALATCDKCARFGLEVYDFAKETDQ